MTMEEKFYADNEMVDAPPKPCEFKVGDVVKFTNDYWVEFEPHKVIGFTKPENELHGRFIHIDTDCPWFPVKPESLTILKKCQDAVGSVRQKVKEGGVVYVAGKEMIASNIRQVTKGGVECIEFKGTCTDSPRNDDIRGTGYDGGTYGGCCMDYEWDRS